MSSLYSERILDHARKPRHTGVLVPADVDATVDYAACGDSLRLTLRFDRNDCISALAWEGDGCAISLAAASMLGERIIGKSLEEVKQVSRQDIFDMLGIACSTSRDKCALLALQTVIVALYGQEEWQWRERNDED